MKECKHEFGYWDFFYLGKNYRSIVARECKICRYKQSKKEFFELKKDKPLAIIKLPDNYKYGHIDLWIH